MIELAVDFVEEPKGVLAMKVKRGERVFNIDQNFLEVLPRIEELPDAQCIAALEELEKHTSLYDDVPNVDRDLM